MVVVTIAGLPKNVKIPKFIAYLENTVFKSALNTRLINTAFIDGTIKSITLSMRSDDARKARRYLDGLEYVYGGNVYPLQCWPEDTHDKVRQRERVDMAHHSASLHEEKYSNYLEQSENSSTIKKELQTIDLKIELIKKQRILMEEENKLLLEKKKSDMLMNIGPNDYENLVKFEKVCGRSSPNEKANLSHPSTSKAKKKTGTKLPGFNAPCKKILSEMEQVLAEFVKPDNNDMIMPLIYAALRKRLIIVLQGKSILPAQDIVDLYRERYPQNTDSKLLEDLTNTLSQSCWPEKENGYTKIDNDTSQIMAKTEEADILDNIKQDTTEDVKEVKQDANNDLKEENEVQIIEKSISSEKVAKDLVSSEDVEEAISSQEVEDKVSSKEPEKNESMDVSLNENEIKEVDNIDQVDMDNDFDEWVENDTTTNENEVEVEEKK